MIPKVATHILHHTSRAAAAVQNQTSQTIRNVLQIQSTGPSQSTPTPRHSGSGSSHWSNNGPGPGGSKFNPNNRFYTGYSGVGRAITQANIPTTHDVTLSQSEERDELCVRPNAVPLRRRPRSHSLSLANHGRAERAESLGILKSVQLRAMHAFTTSPFHNVEDTKVAPEHPGHSRELSTTVTSSVESLDLSMPPPVQPAPVQAAKLSLKTNATSPQTTTPSNVTAEESDTCRALRAAIQSGNADTIAEIVHRFRSTTTAPTIKEYNMALEALKSSRRKGEPLHLILEVYNEMLQYTIVPNLYTYTVLIEALTDRDHEVQKAISTVHVRSKRLLFGDSGSLQETDVARIKQLESENNFSSAMTLFEAALATKGAKTIPPGIYLALLRSCAHHSNVNSAIHVFNELKKRKDFTPARSYLYLLTIFAKTKDLGRANTIFADFRKSCQRGEIFWPSEERKDFATQLNVAHTIQIQVWNKMIETNILCDDPAAALKMLEEMMDSKVDPRTFGLADVPLPATSTYTQIISGFCQVNDVKSALSWFERLRALPTRAPREPYRPLSEPTQPDQTAWGIMLNALAECGMVEDLNRLFSIASTNKSLNVLYDQPLVFNANMKLAKETADSSVALSSLDYVFQNLLGNDLFGQQTHEISQTLVDLYVKHNGLSQAIQVVEWYASSQKVALGNVTESPKEEYWGRTNDYTVSLVKNTIATNSMVILDAFGPTLPFSSVHRLMRVMQEWDTPLAVVPMLATKVVGSYHLAKQSNTLQVTEVSASDLVMLADAAPLFAAAVSTEAAAPVLVELLRDLAKAGADLTMLQPDSSSKIIVLIADALGQAKLKEAIAPLSPSCAQMVEAHYPEANSDDALSQTAASEVSHDTLVDTPVIIDPHHSRNVDEFFHANSSIDVHTAYDRFLSGVEENRYPVPTTFAHLITALGRLGEMDKVKHLYTTCQRVIASLEKNKEWQTQSWFAIEDAMIVALAHAGDLNAAHLHRNRILDQGGAPSADAYGALIQYVKDTTDDTSSAMTLFQESQSCGVRPNIYLYNNIISKLAKARKADYALELFHQMKANRVMPSSITYGALIAACARVGDHYSAEQLFTEMTQQKNFKPRVPPYNTMMQLYTTTKPSRERALFYFDAMRTAGVAPTAHTYKLLIDAYGTIEPLDMASVSKVFRMLENDNKVQMQGSHWASIINAWGCASKNLDKAIEVFDSIASHPKVQRSSVQLPDAVCYEAMINVLVIHRRTDLMAKYIEQLKASGVHMTAYIANFLIKGHAIVGDLEQARTLFETLADPPLGYAAPNNHVPHDGSPSTVSNADGLPVYREPSTWETMIRAELGAGNRDNAVQLLERLRQRQYPEAVYQRISGIMLDDSVSPWAAESSAPASP